MTMSGINFLRGIPDASLFPVVSLRAAADSVLREPSDASLQYGAASGPLRFRQWLASRHNVEASQVMVGNGSLGMLGLLLDEICKPGDTVLIEAPTYDRIPGLLRSKGLVPTAVTLRNGDIDLQEAETVLQSQRPKAAYLIPDFQNPNGTCLPLSTREGLIELARRYEVRLIEDAPYRNLRYTGEQIPSLYELGPDVVILLSSLSKVLVPGLRAGYVVSQASRIESFVRRAEAAYVCPGFTALSLASAWCEQGNLDQHLIRLRSVYGRKLDVFARALRHCCPDLVWTRPEGGFFIGVTLPANISATRIRQIAEMRQLYLGDTSSSFLDARGNQYLRLPFGALTHEELEEGAKRLGESIEAAKARATAEV